MSNMSSLSTALSALYAQRRGLDVTGHNIANANTEGYTRQRVNLVANGGPLSPAIWSKWNGVGQGVDVAGTMRLHDAFLDMRAVQERSVLGGQLVAQQVLGRIEMGFGEPSDLGLAAQLSDFWAGWSDVANNPTDLAARSALLERASTLATNLRSTWNSLSALRTDLVGQMKAQADSVNEMARSIARLNEGIVAATQSGLSPNDLTDQRDLLVSKLADTIGITVKPANGGAVDVLVGGTALVRGTTAQTLDVREGANGVVTVNWSKDGYPATVSGGAMAGLQMSVNSTIPHYLTALDGVANRMRELVNGAHAAGQDLDGNTGIQFFAGTGAADIALSADVRGQPRRLAAAAAGGGPADAANALLLAELAGHRDPNNPPPPGQEHLSGDGPDILYQALIVGLGVEAQAANRRVDIQSEISRQVDAVRDAQAGVNLDEEMTNMLSYQRAYEAAARFMTAIDQMIDRLVNHTGLVGR
jgi:flagellar hook-associated protein 1